MNRSKGRKWKNRKRQREHNRNKEEPKRAPVVPNRSLTNFSADIWKHSLRFELNAVLRKATCCESTTLHDFA
jgi:hypothetical protein